MPDSPLLSQPNKGSTPICSQIFSLQSRDTKEIEISEHTANRKKYSEALSDTMRRYRSIRILHMFRKYSALAVVVASVFLVVADNVQSEQKVQGILPGQSEDDSIQHVNAFKQSSNRQSNIAFIPYVKASTPIEENADDKKKTDETADQEESTLQPDNSSSVAYLQSQALIASANAMEKDPQEGGGVTIYKVEPGDTVSDIADEFDITVNTILWANNFDDIDSIMPGDEIFILPVAGLKHIVKSGDSLDDIAEEYKAEKEQIIAFNSLPANGEIEEGQEIIIPGGEKEVPEPEPASSSLLAKRDYVAPSSGKTVENRHGKANRFPYGYCTWYVAQKKYVPWRGNAGAWLYNAKAMGYSVGSKPKTGSIVVTTDNSYYGHVAIVEKVSGGTITISEMNYNGWGVVNKRTISVNDRKIRGYIY